MLRYVGCDTEAVICGLRYSRYSTHYGVQQDIYYVEIFSGGSAADCDGHFKNAFSILEDDLRFKKGTDPEHTSIWGLQNGNMAIQGDDYRDGKCVFDKLYRLMSELECRCMMLR